MLLIPFPILNVLSWELLRYQWLSLIPLAFFAAMCLFYILVHIVIDDEPRRVAFRDIVRVVVRLVATTTLLLPSTLLYMWHWHHIRM